MLSIFSSSEGRGNAVGNDNTPYAQPPISPVLTNAPLKMWRSRLSWRITTTVFLTILTVQATILVSTTKQEEKTYLNEIRETGRSAIAPVLNDISDKNVSPLTEDKAQKLLTSTLVKGIAVYSADLKILETYGEELSIKIFDDNNPPLSQRSEDGNFYEVVYFPKDIEKANIIVARLDAKSVKLRVTRHVQQSFIIMLLLSTLVTIVLMAALGRWLLEPILFMRNNLLLAQQNPNNPKIPDSPFHFNDELGEAITIAQNLIRTNAENMQQMRSAAEDKIHKLAYFDQLTGLANRTLFIQKLTEQAFSSDTEENKRFAVITLDLDHFKDINDSMGHSIGDAILRGVGKRLRTSLPDNAIVARSGEDEFAVTMPLNTILNNARNVGEKIARIIKDEPFKVYNESFQIRCSVGVSTYPDDDTDPNNVLKNADIALNRAKEDGRDRIREYSKDFDKVVQQRFQLLRDLRDALEKNELTVFYQPQFDLKSGKIIGAEALIRWWKEDDSEAGGKYISPVDFIPVAEQSGLIVPIGEWVMKEACKTAKTWHDNGYDIRIAINLSGVQFFQSDLVGYTESVLKETGIKPELLELEVTESVFMDDINIAIDTLKKLHNLGAILAIDDFGTGYSSLSYLRQFSIDRLKIDQSFIRNALNNNDDAAITRTIINLAHSLNLQVIAEGVETKEHEDFLIKENCDEVQGFRYSKAIPKEEFARFIENYNNDLSSFG